MLSHIKAPAQGGKAGGGKPPAANVANIKISNKRAFGDLGSEATAHDCDDSTANAAPVVWGKICP